MTERDGTTDQPLEWCVVANVARRTTHGPGGEETRSGLRHFAPGAKLWVLPPRYRDEDDRLQVIGIHRGGHRRQVSMVLFRRHLENFRVKGVHSPAVQRARQEGGLWNWYQVWCCPETAQPWADRWNELAAGRPAGGFPPWPARSTFDPDEGPCPHGGRAAV